MLILTLAFIGLIVYLTRLFLRKWRKKGPGAGMAPRDLHFSAFYLVATVKDLWRKSPGAHLSKRVKNR